MGVLFKYLLSILICLVLAFTACGTEDRSFKPDDPFESSEESEITPYSDNNSFETDQSATSDLEDYSEQGVTGQDTNRTDSGLESIKNRYIIQLKEEPVARFKARIRREGRQPGEEEINRQIIKIEKEHEEFVDEIARIEGDCFVAGACPEQSRRAPRNDNEKIISRLKYAIDAVVLETSPERILEICRLPQVVHCEGVRMAGFQNDGSQDIPEDLNNYIEYLGADSVWNMGATGKGVVVGIIDDGGIDETHPDFNCPGEDCNILMNFATESGSHATKVAGIVAANGLKQGIAPDAKLIGFKAHGSDEFIDTAEKILSDKNIPAIDIVNISLQFGDGSPDDAVAYVTESLVKDGIVAVVSAGNEGKDGSFSIRTPASARKVISVGNIYKNKIVDTSSKGPNLNDLQIKPELSAPGTGSWTTDKNGIYSAFSGTSAAAPHVAGAAALLKELHPDWTPEYIRAALMETANPLPNKSIYAQGSGRIDIAKAAETKALVFPPSIGIQPLDPSKESRICRSGCWRQMTRTKWEYKRVLTIHNFGDNTIKYNSPSHLSPEGVNVTIDPKSLILDKNEKQHLIFTITVDFSQISETRAEPYVTFEGSIEIEPDDGPVLRIPYALIISPMMEISIEGSYPKNSFISIYDGNSFVKTFAAYGDKIFAMPIPEGLYDAVVIYGYNTTNTKIVTREGIDHQWGGSKIEINFETEPLYQIKLLSKDHLGADLILDDLIMAVVHPESSWRIRKDIAHPKIQNIYISSTNYSIEYTGHALTDDGDYHFLTYRLDGVLQDMELTNDPGDFIHLVQSFYLPEDIEAISVFDFLSDGRRVIQNDCGSPSTLKNGMDKQDVNWQEYKLTAPEFKRDLYIMPPPEKDFQWRYFYSIGYEALSSDDFAGDNTSLPGAGEQIFRTSLIALSEDGDKLNGYGADTYNHKWPNQIFSLPAEDFTLGITPPIFSNIAYVASDGIVFLNSAGAGTMGAYLGQTGDEWGKPVSDLSPKTLYSDGSSDGSSVTNHDLHSTYKTYDNGDIPFLLWLYDWGPPTLSPEMRTLFIKSGDYPLGIGYGHAVTELRFDIGQNQEDHSPPYLRGLLMTEDSIPTNHFHPGGDFEKSVKISIWDASDLALQSVSDSEKTEEFLKNIKGVDSLIGLPEDVSVDIGLKFPANCSNKSESPSFGSTTGDGKGVMYINKYFECDVEWKPLEVISINEPPYNYEAVIPSDIIPNEYFLKITAKDAAGNSISYRLKPAFTCGYSEDDYDGDDVPNLDDNCPYLLNPDQMDIDEDGAGEACDNCPGEANDDQSDTDRDGVGDKCDDDADGDSIINVMDNCKWVPNTDQANEDDDNYGDVCDNCPDMPTNHGDNIDYDGDGFGRGCDNCPFKVFNPDQTDSDGDGVGDECD